MVSLSSLVFQSDVHTIELVQGNPCPGSSLVKEFASCQAAIVLSWSGMVCLDNLAHQKEIYKVGAGSGISGNEAADRLVRPRINL